VRSLVLTVGAPFCAVPSFRRQTGEKKTNVLVVMVDISHQHC
jgi:hypothetical protein